MKETDKIIPRERFLTILETERLLLRLPDKADIQPIFEATRVPGFNDGMTWNPPANTQEMYPKLDEALENWNSYKGELVFSFDLKAGNHFAGRIGIRKEDSPSTFGIGYFTLPNYAGQGLATEAISAILRFGFTELGANRIEAGHALWNKGSRRAMEKNGMKFTRFVEQGFQKNGEWVSEDFLAITQADWEKLQT